MTDEITPEIFQHLVELAALELSAEEAEYLRRQLNNQLRPIHELEAVPLDPATGVASHGVPYTPAISSVPRPDEWKAWLDPERLLSAAPDSDEGYIVVPDIPHEDLG